MRQLIVIAALLAASPTAAAAQEHAAIRLRCEGVAGKAANQTAFSDYSANNGLSVSGTTMVTGRAEAQAVVRVELDGDKGRIQLPAAFLPPINTRGKDGWWELSDVRAGETEINATARINILNRSTVRISRTSGDIEMKGLANTFVGKCAPETSERLF